MNKTSTNEKDKNTPASLDRGWERVGGVVRQKVKERRTVGKEQLAFVCHPTKVTLTKKTIYLYIPKC